MLLGELFGIGLDTVLGRQGRRIISLRSAATFSRSCLNITSSFSLLPSVMVLRLNLHRSFFICFHVSVARIT